MSRMLQSLDASPVCMDLGFMGVCYVHGTDATRMQFSKSRRLG